MDLIIVESPHKAKTIEKFLGNKYKVDASKGHVRDLPVNHMGINIASGTFEPTYVVNPDKKQDIKRLQEKAKKADKIYRLLKFDNKLINDDFSNWYRRQYKLYYLELLVMADIQLNKSHLSLYDKEKEFVKFFHEKIGLLSDRETNLAKLYFMYGTKIGFFSKIQKGNKNIIKNLKNMAWDIFHIHNTINNLAIQTNKIIDITVPLFVTYDKRLKDILPIYKLKAAAFIKNSSQKWLNYVTNIIDPVIQNEYFVLQAYENRLNRMKENNVDEKSLLALTNSYIESYEQKFL